MAQHCVVDARVSRSEDVAIVLSKKIAPRRPLPVRRALRATAIPTGRKVRESSVRVLSPKVLGLMGLYKPIGCWLAYITSRALHTVGAQQQFRRLHIGTCATKPTVDAALAIELHSTPVRCAQDASLDARPMPPSSFPAFALSM